jgi:hypothetical protein
MPRGTLVVDEKLLRDHFLRQQRGGNIARYRCARFQRGYGIGGIFSRVLRDMLSLYSNKVLLVVGKRALQAATEVGQDVLQGKNVREPVKTHGGDVAKTLLSKEQGLFCVKLGMDAREGEVNAVIYHLSRSKNWKPQDLPNG